MNIGFIGLGIMGKPMAGKLIEGGHTLYLNTRRNVPDELIAAGDRSVAVINNYAALTSDLRAHEPDRLREALTLMDELSDQNNPLFMDTLGWLHYRLADVTRALTYLKPAVRRIPDDPRLRYHLGMAYLGAGDKERAKAELQEAVKSNSPFLGLEDARKTLATL